MDGLVERYRAKTPGSAALMERSANAVAGGVSRNFGFHIPYPVVNDSAIGATIRDVDGNEYIDFAYNGLSLIHGHAYGPIVNEIRTVVGQGWAWPGTSRAQIEYAEYLAKRLPGMDRVRFTNTGTEATMLAVKLARHYTQRMLILKAVAAYHGTFPDLEAGLHGIGEIPGRTLLCEFGDTDGFITKMKQHRDELAALVIEPILLTGGIVPPPDGFLSDITTFARDNGILVILDDCLMLRLAPGGTSELYCLEPDLIALGKFIGGGIPMGAVCGPSQIMRVFESDFERPLYHGGSFNGNVLAARAGLVCMQDLTAERIGRMNRQGDRLQAFLREETMKRQMRANVTGVGSVVGISFASESERKTDYYTEITTDLKFHLACLVNGLQPGAGGVFAFATAFNDSLVDDVERRLVAALDAVAGAG